MAAHAKPFTYRDVYMGKLTECKTDVLYCFDPSSAMLVVWSARLDVTVAVIFHAMLLLSDILLVYRCYIMMQNRWLIWGLALVPALASFGLLMYNAITQYGANASIFLYLGATVSILTNVIVSTSLIARIQRRQREVEELTEHTHFHLKIPYTYVTFVLFESAFPPVALGLVSLALLPVYRYTGCVRLLWLSMTVLSPQIIALRVLRGRNRTQATLGVVPTISIGFCENTA
ncbi:hypothetical protein BKA70DRAFT_1400634, partial [Coprinopsis sp. MPI-PUGE-AT-0042]